jgi:hypothetical protein
VHTLSVDVDELVALFAGEPAERAAGTDVWVSAPCYSIRIAQEVAARIAPTSEGRLRERFYGNWPIDQIPEQAVRAISLGYQRWQQARYKPPGRGL